jgi:hypothetical protein
MSKQDRCFVSNPTELSLSNGFPTQVTTTGRVVMDDHVKVGKNEEQSV